MFTECTNEPPIAPKFLGEMQTEALTTDGLLPVEGAKSSQTKSGEGSLGIALKFNDCALVAERELGYIVITSESLGETVQFASAKAYGVGEDSDVPYSATVVVDKVYVDAAAEYDGDV